MVHVWRYFAEHCFHVLVVLWTAMVVGSGPLLVTTGIVAAGLNAFAIQAGF